MRGLVLGVIVAALAGGAAAAAEADGPKTAPKPSVWGCKVDREPARKAPSPNPSKAAPREGRLYLLDQPVYCDAPKPAPKREAPEKAARA
jgi:hypothetical protein